MRPIPLTVEPPNWGRLPIEECGESLVAVPTTPRLRSRALYAEQGIPDAPTVVMVREGVLKRLVRAAEGLPDGLTLVVFDGYRPLAVQRWLYESFRETLRAAHPELDAEALTRLLGQYVASPVADPLQPPPHRSGGATDVYLVDASGTPVPMGTEPDEAVAASATRWFEERVEEPYTSNRRLLYHAMADAGFANYLGEWWHYDYGNQRWANLTDAPNAIYGLPQETPYIMEGI